MKDKQIIINYFKNIEHVKWTTMKKFFELYPRFKKLAEYIFNRNKNWESSTNVILAIARNEKLPNCKYCGKQLIYTFRYSSYCSKSCLNKDPETQAKIKATKLQRYGSENYNNSEQRKETCLEKYGVENAAKSEQVKQKAKETCLKKYDVEYTTQTEIMKEKSAKTKELKYNNKNYVNTIKAKETILTKQYNKFLNDENIIPLFSRNAYEGVIYYNKLYNWECKHCHTKFKASCYAGIPKCKNCVDKLYGTSKQEIELINFCKDYFSNLDSHNFKFISPFELDILIPEIKLAIEFNGNYWHSIELKEKGYHLNKVNLCNNLNYRLVHIWEDDWKDKKEEIKEKLKLIFLNKEQFIDNFIILDNSWYNNIEDKLMNYEKLDLVEPINILRDKFYVENCGYTLLKRKDYNVYIGNLILENIKKKIYTKFNVKDIQKQNNKFEMYYCNSIEELKEASKHLNNFNGNTVSSFLKQQIEVKKFVENIFNSNQKKYCTLNKTFIALAKDIEFRHCKVCGKELNYDQTWNQADFCSNKCKLTGKNNPFSREDVKAKIRRTNYERYGVENPAQRKRNI